MPCLVIRDRSRSVSPIAVAQRVEASSVVENTPKGKFDQEKGEFGLTSGTNAIIETTAGHASDAWLFFRHNGFTCTISLPLKPWHSARFTSGACCFEIPPLRGVGLRVLLTPPPHCRQSHASNYQLRIED